MLARLAQIVIVIVVLMGIDLVAFSGRHTAEIVQTVMQNGAAFVRALRGG